MRCVEREGERPMREDGLKTAVCPFTESEIFLIGVTDRGRQ